MILIFADEGTLTVSPVGLMNIPGVCSWHPPKYPNHVIAAASAKELWAGQKARDDAHPEKAKKCEGGYLGPIERIPKIL
jgi:hypothetical protein